MWNVIKIELKIAIINKKFVIVILLGCIMAVLAFVDTPGFTIAINWYKYMHNDEMASMIINKMNEVDTPLEIWMPRYGASSTFYNVWIAILPILVVIPYATEYLKEKKSGLINQFMVRMTKKKYYMSRYIVTFISAGLVAVIPLVFNLMVVMCFLPWGTPIRATGLYPVVTGNVFENVFYNYPLLYVIIYLIYTFVEFGLLSCICLTCVYIEDNWFAVTLTPFILYFSEHVFLTIGLGLKHMSLLGLTNMYNVYINNINILIIQLAVLFIVNMLFFIRVRGDVL